MERIVPYWVINDGKVAFKDSLSFITVIVGVSSGSLSVIVGKK